MTDNITVLDIKIPNVDVIPKTEDEIVDLLRKKDPSSIQLLKKGIVLFGEDKFVEIIKKCVQRF